LNILFLSVGRTGYLTLFFALSAAVYFQIPKRYRLLTTVLIVITLATLMFHSSSRFQSKVSAIGSGIQKYSEGEIGTSEGMRLDFWTKSLDAIKEKPVIGHGVGSWKLNYSIRSGLDINNPHQEFLLWAVEGGAIGLLLLLAIFVACYWDARLLEPHVCIALRIVLGITFLSCMANSSLRDAGIREFIFLLIATLLAVRTNHSTSR
jgi:O-antigen ligase